MRANGLGESLPRLEPQYLNEIHGSLHYEMLKKQTQEGRVGL